jgi:hypothetical protein
MGFLFQSPGKGDPTPQRSLTLSPTSRVCFG